MYGKIFKSIYDGTLAEDWRALITFQQFIILCNADGMLDMTPQAISRRTGIPIEHIKAGIDILEKPDKYSRTQNEEGCRIELIDEHRPWGWHIVNHEKYRDMKDMDTVREQTRKRVKKHREKKRLRKEEESSSNAKNVTKCYGNESNEKKRHVDTDKDEDKDIKDQTHCRDEKKIIDELNLQTGKKFTYSKTNLKFITGRLKEGHSFDDIMSVISMKVRKWKNDPRMFEYLRPATLFNATKFNQYVGEINTVQPIAEKIENLSMCERATKARLELEEQYQREHQKDIKFI